MLCCILNTDYVCRNCHEKYCMYCVLNRYKEPDCVEGRPTCRKCAYVSIWVKVRGADGRIDKAIREEDEEERLLNMPSQSQVQVS